MTHITMQESIEFINSYYLKNFRLLETLDETYPSTQGTFSIPNTLYTVDERPGLSGVGSMILINQAVISYFLFCAMNHEVDSFEHDHYKDIEKSDIPESMVIANMNAKYKGIITRHEPLALHVTFNRVMNKLSTRNAVFLKGRVNVCEGKHIVDFTAVYDGNKNDKLT